MFRQEFNIFKDGTKKVLLVAGIHGNELSSIHCLMQIAQQLTKFLFITNKQIAKITVLNFVNQDAINTKQRSYHYYDLNRDFDINSKPQLKTTIEVIEEVNNHDIIIDMHCYGTKHLTKNIVLINNNTQAQTYVDFCHDYEIDFALQNNYQNSLKQYAIDLGKKAFTVELAGGLNKINIKHSDNAARLIYKILNYFNPQDYDNHDNQPYEQEFCLEHLHSTNTGIFINNQIFDANLKLLSSYKAYEQNIIFTTTNDFVTKGDYVVSIQPRIY